MKPKVDTLEGQQNWQTSRTLREKVCEREREQRL